MLVVDDFLDEETFEKVKTLFLGRSGVSPTYMYGITPVLEELDLHSEGGMQFTTPNDADFTAFINTGFLQKIGLFSVQRFKCNITLKGEKIIEHGFHTDLDTEDIGHLHPKSAVFYLNTCDGYTAFRDGQKIESLANRYVEFDTHLQHTGTNTTNAPFRAVLNINFIPKNKFPRAGTKRFE